ncbi:MAG: DUF4435 domain-containing protein [Planctomycetota bacterium]|jgi:ABC-type cobalamin/Fe3+-siderophores transport system ATPase subunit
MADITTLLKQIEITIDSLEFYKKVAIDCAKIPPTEVKILGDTKELCNSVLQAIKHKSGLPENYIANLNQHIKNIYDSVPFKNHHKVEVVVQQYPDAKVLKQEIDRGSENLKRNFDAFKFNFDVFVQLDFFENNIVLIGANGSGKTTLANNLKKTFNPNNGIVISAQRVLRVSKYSNITSVSETIKKLNETRSRDKTYKKLNDYGYMQDEFDVVMQNLVADNVAAGLEYSNQSKKKVPHKSSPKTSLDRAIEIWNSLIGHRQITIAEDHINIVPRTKDGITYDLVQMSEGEKVMLYLIAQILQAPEDGFIIVDEPEIFLHRAILKKLWNHLERERNDCIFVYLTHDIPFATSRESAQKIWMRSYTPPNKWVFEAINNNELPEELLLELLGSYKKVLFCEGEVGGDEIIYNILFPNFTIKPVGSCKNVIDYVRAFNRIPNRLSNAFGVIDADFREQQELTSLKEGNVFSIKVAEIENLLLDEGFLSHCATRLHCDDSEVDRIKARILAKFNEDIEMQVSHFVSAKINHIFNNYHVRKGNDITVVNEEYVNFTEQIDIQKWYKGRKQLIEKIVIDKDYTKAIKYYNNKGLIAIAADVFDKSDFRKFAIKHLKNNTDGQNELKKYFPPALLKAHNANCIV